MLIGKLHKSSDKEATMEYPIVKKEKIEESFFGKTFADPYRWMEDEKNPELEKWIESQKKLTKEYLENINDRETIQQRLRELYDYPKFFSARMIGEKIIYSYNTGLQLQNVFYIQDKFDFKERVLIDPNQLSEDGTVAVTLNEHSHDKKYLSVLESKSGSDWQILRVLDLEKEEYLQDTLSWVKFTWVAWKGDGFYYSRYDAPEQGKELSQKNENMKVYYHQLGTNQEEDILIFEDSSHPLRYNSIEITKDESFLILSISEGTYGNEIRIKEVESEKPFEILFEGFQNEYTLLNRQGNELFFITDQGASNRRVIAVNVNTKETREVIGEQTSNLEYIWDVGDKWMALYLKNVSSQVVQYNMNGVKERELQLPGIGMVYSFSGDETSEVALFSFGSFTYPNTLFSVNKSTGEICEFKKPLLNFDNTKYMTEQIFCKSKDKTLVPVFLTYRKDILKNGENPMLLYAYGGFGVSIPPSFDPGILYFMEKGGVYAQANLRGGAEYGEDWHKAGMLLNKQNCFDDFISVAETLIEKGYTSSTKLAIQGASNGGLLIGSVLNQRPDLFQVAFPQVGVMDMLRYHKFTVGWGWMVEYGNPEEEVHFSNIFSYSPIHNIQEKDYPAIMVMTADHDDRVVPSHSYKYIATIQEKNKGIFPTLIRIESKAGHGMGKSYEKVIQEYTDMYAFLFENISK